jgi:hypothetical protein
MYPITTELYLIGLMNFHWLRKVFYLQRGQVLGRTLYIWNSENVIPIYYSQSVFHPIHT